MIESANLNKLIRRIEAGDQMAIGFLTPHYFLAGDIVCLHLPEFEEGFRQPRGLYKLRAVVEDTSQNEIRLNLPFYGRSLSDFVLSHTNFYGQYVVHLIKRDP